MNKLFELAGKTALIKGVSSDLVEQFVCILSVACVLLATQRTGKLESLSASRYVIRPCFTIDGGTPW